MGKNHSTRVSNDVPSCRFRPASQPPSACCSNSQPDSHYPATDSACRRWPQCWLDRLRPTTAAGYLPSRRRRPSSPISALGPSRDFGSVAAGRRSSVPVPNDCGHCVAGGSDWTKLADQSNYLRGRGRRGAMMNSGHLRHLRPQKTLHTQFHSCLNFN